jgi:PatG Domain
MLELRGDADMAPGNEPPRPRNEEAGALSTPAAVCTCPGHHQPKSFVYALGTVELQYPDPSIVDELLNVARTQNNTEPLFTKTTDRLWLYSVLSTPAARYVARKLCWVLTIEGHPAYSLVVRDSSDVDDLISCLERTADGDLDAIVGSSSLAWISQTPSVYGAV